MYVQHRMQHQCCINLGRFMGKNLGNRLVYLRENKGLSQQEAAIKLGIPERTLQSHEYGQWPNRKNQQKYIDFYGCSRIWFLTDEGVPFPDQEASEKPAINRVDNDTSRQIDASFGTAVDALKEIFDSHDPAVIDTVRTNLYLCRSHVRKDFEMKQQSKEIQTLKEDHKELKKRIAALEDEEDDAGSL